MRKLPVLLVEDSLIFRSALANVLSWRKALDVTVCSSSCFVNGIRKINQVVVVIDAVTWAAGPQTLLEAVQQISKAAPVILLVREDLPEIHLEALRKGPVGCVKQTAPTRLLLKAVRAVASGETWFEKSVFQKVFVRDALAKNWRQGTSFAPTELQIMDFVARGKTNKEIGAYLGFAERTIKAYMSSLFRKAGVPNRSGLASYAVRHGFARFTDEPAT